MTMERNINEFWMFQVQNLKIQISNLFYNGMD